MIMNTAVYRDVTPCGFVGEPLRWKNPLLHVPPSRSRQRDLPKDIVQDYTASHPTWQHVHNHNFKILKAQFLFVYRRLTELAKAAV
jgi:hypothetical protein